MTVLEYLGEDEFHKLGEKAEASPYWESSLTFIEQNQNKDVNNLSPKQKAWLDKIVEGLL